jgi:membrane peptidoglycan carboxypeptidase
MIDQALAFDYKFTEQNQRNQLKAPHFVFYVEKLLEQRGYNYGQPFTKENLETSGYKIYTTLDLDYQQVADEQVQIGVNGRNRKLYGGDNAALMALNPNNGEILAMVGSKDYFGEATPTGCSGPSCSFSPKVNVLDTLQSVGSSLKPQFYYFAFEKGLITPGSTTPDIPIKMRGYGPKGPKNFEGGYQGLLTARTALANSRNIPPIYMVDYLGVDNFVNEMRKWGYTSLNDPRGYGPSIVIGGADINLIEHAQGYGILATGGKFVQNEAVLKIIDKDGNTVYEAKPNPVQVADPRAVFLVNDVLNGRKGGPGISFDGRDTAGKTGTSEGQKETLYITYTPEIVVLGWYGNNNNASLKGDPSGFSSARPWISDFLKRVEGNIPKTPFNRPAGVVSGTNCSASDGASCDGKGDLAIVDIHAPAYLSVKNVTVCIDETNKLARDIDIALGFSTTISVKKYTMPNPNMQPYLDAYLAGKPELNGIIPTEPCDIIRATPTPTPTPTPVTDTITITSPTDGQNVGSGPFTVDFTTTGTITAPELFVDGVMNVGCAATSCSWTSDGGSHTLIVKGNSGVVVSNPVSVI